MTPGSKFEGLEVAVPLPVQAIATFKLTRKTEHNEAFILKREHNQNASCLVYFGWWFERRQQLTSSAAQKWLGPVHVFNSPQFFRFVALGYKLPRNVCELGT